MDGNQNKSWFSRFMSVNEEKTSALVASFIVFSGLAVYCVLTKGDIPPSLTTLLTLEAGVIGGVNCVNFVANNLSMNKSQNGMVPMKNQYGYSNSYSPYGNSSMGMGMNGMSTMGMNQMPMNNSMMPTSTLNQTGQPVISTSATTSTAANMQRPI